LLRDQSDEMTAIYSTRKLLKYLSIGAQRGFEPLTHALRIRSSWA
jgi:hypothetical protein